MSRLKVAVQDLGQSNFSRTFIPDSFYKLSISFWSFFGEVGAALLMKK